MTLTQTLDHLKQKASPQYLAGMSRFGIDNSKALGVKIPYVLPTISSWPCCP